MPESLNGICFVYLRLFFFSLIFRHTPGVTLACPLKRTFDDLSKWLHPNTSTTAANFLEDYFKKDFCTVLYDPDPPGFSKHEVYLCSGCFSIRVLQLRLRINPPGDGEVSETQ